MRIGLFGGTFNPPHNGHIALARSLLGSGLVDVVWLMVSPQNPWKRNDKLLDDAARLALARAAVNGEPGIVASDYEMHLPRPSYTWHTLRHLSTDHPADTFMLLIGGDNWQHFDQWYHAADILATHDIVVYPRSGYPLRAGALPANVHALDAPLADVSSTMVRERVRLGLSIAHLVPHAVASLIAERGFYAEQRPKTT